MEVGWGWVGVIVGRGSAGEAGHLYVYLFPHVRILIHKDRSSITINSPEILWDTQSPTGRGASVTGAGGRRGLSVCGYRESSPTKVRVQLSVSLITTPVCPSMGAAHVL